MNKPKISVVIPLYNKEKIVEESLRSVLSQDFDSFEVVVVNDGSTDRSMEIVRSINDPRILLVEQKNGGPSKARNTGVKKAQADWIAFLDADDELLPGALQLFYKKHQEHPEADVIDCARIHRFPDGKQTVNNHPWEGFVPNPMKECYFGHVSLGPGCSLFRKSKLLECPYDERLRRYEDAELLLRLLPICTVYSCKEPTFIVNTSYSAASKPRKNIDEDALGHLNFKRGGFWGLMATFRFFIEERENYPEECHRLYPSWYWRYDLLLLHKLLNLLK